MRGQAFKGSRRDTGLSQEHFLPPSRQKISRPCSRDPPRSAGARARFLVLYRRTMTRRKKRPPAVFCVSCVGDTGLEPVTFSV